MSLTLADVHRALEKQHGGVGQKGAADPWELLLWENVADLVSDDRRAQAFRSLEREIGLAPEKILATDRTRLAGVIADGGMLPDLRADKVLACARVVTKMGGVEALRALVTKGDVQAAYDALQVFPSIGGPGADRLLLLLHRKKKLAPESNALRVMSRLGWVEETASYSTTYRNANEALRPQLPDDWKTLVSMHQLLKVHGQEVCKPKKPRCASCPLAAGCPRRGLD